MDITSLSYATKRGDDFSVPEAVERIRILDAHATKLMAQAIYLDTYDRNSWAQINSNYGAKAHIIGQQETCLRRFWKGLLDPVKRERHESTSEPSF